MVAQGLPPILLAEYTAMLEFWHDETNEVFVSSRSVCWGNNKAIARALYQPLFELVGNLLRPADDRVMNPAAAAEVKKITHRWVSIPAGAHHAVSDRLKTRADVPGELGRDSLLVLQCRHDVSLSI